MYRQMEERLQAASGWRSELIASLQRWVELPPEPDAKTVIQKLTDKFEAHRDVQRTLTLEGDRQGKRLPSRRSWAWVMDGMLLLVILTLAFPHLIDSYGVVSDGQHSAGLSLTSSGLPEYRLLLGAVSRQHQFPAPTTLAPTPRDPPSGEVSFRFDDLKHPRQLQNPEEIVPLVKKIEELERRYGNSICFMVGCSTDGVPYVDLEQLLEGRCLFGEELLSGLKVQTTRARESGVKRIPLFEPQNRRAWISWQPCAEQTPGGG